MALYAWCPRLDATIERFLSLRGEGRSEREEERVSRCLTKMPIFENAL